MEASDTTTSLETAIAHQRAGRLAEAEAIYRGILKGEPNNADVLHMYGCLALQAGWTDIAAKAIERAIAVNGQVSLYHVSLGQTRLQSRQPQQALESFRAAIALAPDSAIAHFLAAFVLADSGRMGEARAAYEKGLAIKPDFPQALFNLGAILQGEGDRTGALERYRAALALVPDFAEAHLNLGICLAEGGDPAAAAPHLERAAALQPNRPEAHDALGNALVEMDEPERAVASYRRALALDDKAAKTHFNLGNAFRKQDRLEAALVSYHDALALDPGLASAALGIGGVARDLGRREEAEKYFRRALAIDPRSVLAEVGLSLTLRLERATAEALAAAERAVALDPGEAEAHTALGICLQDYGRFEEAEAAFRRALALKPDNATALYHLANLGQAELGDAELERMQAMLARPRLERETRVGLNFALGTAFDGRGDYDRAFAFFRAGNELRAAQHPFDLAVTERLIDDIIAMFDAAFFAQHEGFGQESDRPVFVLGMPRSGTTLVEQILASHPEVHGAGELNASSRVLDLLHGHPGVAASGLPYPRNLPLLDRDSARRLGAFFLERLGKDAGDARRVTDKAPGNFVHIGLIAYLLPRTRIIHCMRDPIDTCLSCYFQNFLEPIPFAYGLDRLGGYYRLYERLMAHWRKLRPAALLDVQYEALVAEPEPWTRRILEFCDLPWNDASLRFFAAERAVQTASFWQVRQPIYQSSVARWRHYERHLGPLFQALGREPAPAASGDAA
jgi:tetratricopeptide (TPR) repeat protein